MLGGNKRKPAPPLKKAAVVEKESTELPRPLFRGFIGGDAFITKKGYRGLRLDTLWVQNIFESLKTDDEELAMIALTSPLADVNDRVCGGICGAPFSIGDYGFYAQTQFEPQLKYLQDKIRAISVETKVYLSGSEWDDVEKRLFTMANHGTAAFTRTAVGDSFAALAIRQSAFQVAKACMNAGIDPLVENVEGKDMFDVMKEQYKNLSTQLKETQDLKDEAQHRVMVPSAVEHVLSEELRLLDNFHYLSDFSDELKLNLENRIVDINKDKILQRRAMLRNESFPDQKVWNIAQQEKAEKYLEEIVELKGYIVEKIHFHEIHAGKFESLGALLVANSQLLKLKDDESSVTTTLNTQDQDSMTSRSRSSVRRGSIMSRPTSTTPSGRLTREPSTVSLKGDDDDSERTHSPRVGFILDDDSLLTEEGIQSRIPKLPVVPNRLRNSNIDGRATVEKMRARKQKAAPVVAPPPPDALAKLLMSDGREDTRVNVASPRAGAGAAGVASPRSSNHPGALVVRPSSAGLGFSHSHSHSGPNTPTNDSQVAIHRVPPMRASSSHVGFDLSPRPGTGDSHHTSSDRFGDSTPGTPSQKMRKSQSGKAPSILSTKKELYEALGVADVPDDASSVATPSRGGKPGGVLQQSAVPLSSAKILAKSLKYQYSPLLGTFRETANAVIMYR